MKLTSAQREMLEWMRDKTAGVAIAFWGGKPFSMPFGRWRTLDNLCIMGLVRCSVGERFDRVFTLTPAGRAALKEEK